MREDVSARTVREMASEGEGARRVDESAGSFDIGDRDRWLMMGVFPGRVIICPTEIGRKVVDCPYFVKAHTPVHRVLILINKVQCFSIDIEY